MAKVLFGEFVDGVRGKIGGLVWSANASGPYVKSLRTPVKASTIRRSAQQTLYSEMTEKWRALPQAKRDGWNTFAAAAAQDQTDSLGNTYSLNGFQWHSRINMWRRAIDSTWQTTYPTIAKPSTAAVTSIYFEKSGGTDYCGCTTTDATLGSNLIVIAAVPIFDTQRESLTTGYRTFTPIRDDTGATSYWDIDMDAFEAYWGEPTAQMRCFMNVFVQTTQGYRSAPYFDYVDYTP